MPHLLPVAAVLLVLAALVVAAWLTRRARRRRFVRKVGKLKPTLKHPVVLAHGIMGFDQVKTGPLKGAKYFRGVEPHLKRLGSKVYAFRVHPSASVPARAQELARAVAELPDKRVNVVAHSMGGLDARYAVAKLGLAKKVCSITTIGTPHRGTPLADLGTGLWGVAPAAKKLFEKMGLEVEGFFELTTAKMEAFNAEVPNAAGVYYGSWVASGGGLLAMNPLLLPTWKLIREKFGENDGLVPTASQEWGEVCGTIAADHWAQIGWSPTFDAPAFYENVVRELSYRGL